MEVQMEDFMQKSIEKRNKSERFPQKNLWNTSEKKDMLSSRYQYHIFGGKNQVKFRTFHKQEESKNIVMLSNILSLIFYFILFYFTLFCFMFLHPNHSVHRHM